MRRPAGFLAALFAAACLLTAGVGPASAQLPAPFPVPTLEWLEPVLGPIGSGGLFVADIDADGRQEIVAGARSFFWQVLRHDGSRLETVFHSPLAPLRAGPPGVLVHQADDDDFLEILYSAADGVHIVEGGSLRLERTLPTPEGGGFLAVADVDGDGSAEVVVHGGNLSAYDLATGALEWTTEGVCGGVPVLGQADEDAALEIATAGFECAAALYDGATGALEGSFPAELGDDVRFADLLAGAAGGPEGARIDELILWRSWDAGANRPGNVTVFDLAAGAPAYVLEEVGASVVEVFDIDGDGAPEIVYGTAQGGRVVVVGGATGAEEASLQLPSVYPAYEPVTALAVGDADGDGRTDLVWTSGAPGGLLGQLDVADLESPVAGEVLRGVEGPFHSLAAGDVDGDGAPELLRVLIDPTQSPYRAHYQRLSVASRQVEHTSPGFPVGRENEPPRVATANVDGDPQAEVFLGLATPDGGGELRCFDGRNHGESWALSLEAPVRALHVADVDGNGDAELIVRTVPVPGPSHTGLPRVYAVDAATGALLWTSEPISPSGEWALLRVAELDGSPGLEILLFSDRSPVVLDAVTGAVEAAGQPLWPEAEAVDTFDADGDGIDEVYIATDESLRRIDPATGTVLASLPVAGLVRHGLVARDFNGDGTTDFLYGGQDFLYLQDGAVTGGGPEALVWRSGPTPAFPGTDDGLLAADIDGDRRLEIVAGTYLAIWAFELPNPAELFRDGFESGDLSGWPGAEP